MLSVLVPASLGAFGGLVYGSQHGIDRKSAAIGGTAGGLGIAMLVREDPIPAQNFAFAGALLSLIVYDRWHDHMWPFAPA